MFYLLSAMAQQLAHAAFSTLWEQAWEGGANPSWNGESGTAGIAAAWGPPPPAFPEASMVCSSCTATQNQRGLMTFCPQAAKAAIDYCKALK